MKTVVEVVPTEGFPVSSVLFESPEDAGAVVRITLANESGIQLAQTEIDRLEACSVVAALKAFLDLDDTV